MKMYVGHSRTRFGNLWFLLFPSNFYCKMYALFNRGTVTTFTLYCLSVQGLVQSGQKANTKATSVFSNFNSVFRNKTAIRKISLSLSVNEFSNAMKSCPGQKRTSLPWHSNYNHCIHQGKIYFNITYWRSLVYLLQLRNICSLRWME